jgi:hypothetical protein
MVPILFLVWYDNLPTQKSHPNGNPHPLDILEKQVMLLLEPT